MPYYENYLACGLIHHNSGKSTLLENLLAQDVQMGHGVVLVERKGDLFHAMLNQIPRDRLKDVIVMNLADHAQAVGYNILAQGNPQIVASEIQHIFNHIYGNQGVRMPEALYHSLITLMVTKAGGPYTFVDLMPLLFPTNREETLFSEAVVRGVDDPYIGAFWQSVNNMSRSDRDRYFEPLRSRIWQLNARPEVRRVIGQSNSTFDMRDIVANRKILLVNLAGLSDEAASLMGALLINNLWHAVKEGLSSPVRPVVLALDEFQNYLHMPIAPDVMLAEARSFGLSLHLAHQHLGQITSKDLLSAVMNNAVSKIVFQRGADDARAFAAEFGSLVTEEDFKRLGQYEVITKVASNGGISPPITAVTLPPKKPEGFGQQVVNRSRALYSRTAADIEAEIRKRRTSVVPKGAKKPKLGDEDYAV